MTKQFMAVTVVCLLTVVLAACAQPGAATPTATTEPGPPAAASEIEAIAPVAAITGMPAGSDGFDWWNDTTFYEIFVRSFSDSDGDGIGDFDGLTAKLDYLNDGDPETTTDLGITGIWLMPIMESPSYHGYDVTDYFKVNPEYGTEEDFKRFLEEAHNRGIRVVIDMVLNHTSNDHPWFEDSETPGAEHDNWYVWSNEDPGFAGPWGQDVWHNAGDRYYYGIFWEGMPDLNYRNPEVTAQMYEASRYWLEDMGVDGFRLDAIRHLIEDGEVQENTPETHAWLQAYRDFLTEIEPEAMTVGEIWTTTDNVVPYVKDGEVDLAFEFDLAEAMVSAAKGETRGPVAGAQFKAWNAYPPGQYAPFLTNHDQERVMSQLGGDEGKARVAALLLLTSPGVPFIYYGEEIGMIGTKPDEQIRTPMQWTAEEDAGFTTGDPWIKVKANYPEVNVAAQRTDPDSLWNTYRSLVHLRNNHVALRTGDYTKVDVADSKVYAFLRSSPQETVLVLINLGSEPVSDYELNLAKGPLSGSVTAVEVLHGTAVTSPTITPEGGFKAYKPLDTLAPQTGYVIQLGGREE
jgi:glycosidase